MIFAIIRLFIFFDTGPSVSSRLCVRPLLSSVRCFFTRLEELRGFDNAIAQDAERIPQGLQVCFFEFGRGVAHIGKALCVGGEMFPVAEEAAPVAV